LLISLLGLALLNPSVGFYPEGKKKANRREKETLSNVLNYYY
jgi:hypothetical protein